MNSDGLLVNDGQYYHESADQKLEKRTEKGQAVEGLKLVEAMIERIDERIEFYKSIDSIADEATLSSDKFMHIVRAHKILVELLSQERDYLAVLLDQYKK
jgi:hypothetical protein